MHEHDGDTSPVPGYALPMDLESWFVTWTDARTGHVTSERQRSDEARYRRYVAPRWGRKSIDRIRSRAVQSWADAPSWPTTSGESDVGPATRYACVMVLRQVLQVAVDAEALTQNPAAAVRVAGAPNSIRPRSEDNLIGLEQAQRVVDAMDDLHRPLALLALRLGTSWSEAMGLQLEDLEPRQSRITIGRLLGVEVGGRQSTRIGSERVLQMPPDLGAALESHTAATAAVRAQSDIPWLFLTATGKRPLRANWNRLVLRPALVRAGLSPSAVTFHSLRHVAARAMLEGGASLEDLQRTLGHRSLTTTKRFYAR